MRALFLALSLVLAQPVLASEAPSVLSVTGSGSVAAVPDMATVSIGVESQGETAADALAENTGDAGAVIAALKRAGIEVRDIQTSNFSVNPVYSDRKIQTRQGPEVVGYRVFNQVTARVRALDNLGEILDEVVSTGANRINGIGFGLQDDQEARDQARKLAVADARRKAELYAEAAGVTLGPILSISEAGGVGGPRPMSMMMEARAAVPIEAGSTSISAQISITWAIGG